MAETPAPNSVERAKLRRIETITRNLFELMPGAPEVPRDELGKPLWGEVEDCQHYDFCNGIANLIVRNSALTIVDPD